MPVVFTYSCQRLQVPACCEVCQTPVGHRMVPYYVFAPRGQAARYRCWKDRYACPGGDAAPSSPAPDSTAAMHPSLTPSFSTNKQPNGGVPVALMRSLLSLVLVLSATVASAQSMGGGAAKGLSEVLDHRQREQELKILASGPAAVTPSAVFVIAPSLSTRMKAQDVVTKNRLIRVSLRHAHAVLVIVRSSLDDPLLGSFESLCALQTAAGQQLNISGPMYHLYLYQLDENLRPYLLVAHQTQRADD